MKIPIIYEDEAIVVIDKPSGVVCNRAETVKDETLQDWMRRKYQLGKPKLENGSEENYFYERSGLVHRLDKETTGLMVLAKTPESFVELLRQFREREVEKEYLALTHGLWAAPSGVIRLPVGRARYNRRQMGVREDGRESESSYQVMSEYRRGEFPPNLKVNDKGYTGFSLVKFEPRTGRTHQIRVHAKQMGHPLVGDDLYGGRKRSREDRKWCEGLMLQAVKLSLSHPVTQGRVSWEGKDRLSPLVGRFLC